MLVRPLMRFAPLAPSFRDKSRQGENDVRRGLRNPWNQVIRATVLLSAALLFGAACDDDDNDADGNICADGTVEVDGECVLDTRVCGPGTELRGTRCEAIGGDDLECGEGTVEVSGECVPSSTVECGPGTTLNTDGECIPDSIIECGPGTVEADGQCVPESTGSPCGDGTVLDEASGECVPDLGLVCGAGTVAVDGECIDTLEALRRMTSIPEANEPNDPLLGGAPRVVTLAPAGDSVLLNGTIGVADPVDGADWDGWSITTTEPGQVIRVTGVSAGLPAPWFALLGDLDGDDLYDYQRTSPTNEDAQPWRDFVLPVPGEYLLFVTDRLNASGGSSGSPAYEYYAIVETLPPLTAAGATSVTVGAAPITVAPDSQKPVHDNVFLITPSAGADELVVFDRPVFDNAYAFQSLLLFDPSDMSFAGIESFTFCVEDIFGTQCYLRGPFGREVSASGLVAVLDADSISGFGQFGATVTLEAAPALSSNAQGTLDNGGLDFYVADVSAGTLLEIQVEGEADVQPLVQLLSAEGQALTLAQDDDDNGIVTARWYFDTDSRVQVLVGDGAFEDPAGTNYGYTLAADMIPVASLGQLDASSPTASLDNIALDSASNDSTWIAFEVVPTGPASAGLTVNSIAEVGFDLYKQSAGQFSSVGSAFPLGGEASTQASVSEPGWILAQLVALSGADSAIEATATLAELQVYSGEGDTCQTAVALAGSGSFVVDLPAYTSTLTGSGVFGDCGGTTGSARSGQDSFFIVDVPDGMTLSVDVTGSGNGDDALLALLENSATLCSNIGVDTNAFTCLAYNDDRDINNWDFTPFASWTNDTGSPVEVMVVVDNWYTSSAAGDNNLVTITIAP